MDRVAVQMPRVPWDRVHHAALGALRVVAVLSVPAYFNYFYLPYLLGIWFPAK
jgi:hypothetical protein